MSDATRDARHTFALVVIVTIDNSAVQIYISEWSRPRAESA